ncbi:MAG: hypothetical protein IPM40_06130 [Gammaproteobacteria bacterium]|nr:hypothetical protein [Gammaproteobacteria bacterium]
MGQIEAVALDDLPQHRRRTMEPELGAEATLRTRFRIDDGRYKVIEGRVRRADPAVSALLESDDAAGDASAHPDGLE